MNTTAWMNDAASERWTTVEDFLSPSLCRALIARGEEMGFGEAPITTGTGFVMMKEVRNNTRVMFDDFELAASIWSRLARHVPHRIGIFEAVGLNERFRFYRYAPGQYFRWHHDGSFVRSREERSFLTMLLYLNEDCVGGETEFDVGERFSVRPRTGRVLLFEHQLRHQGAPVREGRKYVLRTDVMYRRE